MAVCDSNGLITEPRDSPMNHKLAPSGGFPSASSRRSPIEPSIEMLSRFHTRTVPGVPKGHSAERERVERAVKRTPTFS